MPPMAADDARAAAAGTAHARRDPGVLRRGLLQLRHDDGSWHDVDAVLNRTDLVLKHVRPARSTRRRAPSRSISRSPHDAYANAYSEGAVSTSPDRDMHMHAPAVLDVIVDGALAIDAEAGPPQRPHVCRGVVVAKRAGEPLGLSIAGGADTDQHGVSISEIREGSAAARTGGLRVGDVLLQVGNERVDGLAHAEAAAVLRRARTETNVQLMVGIVVDRPASATPQPLLLRSADDDPAPGTADAADILAIPLYLCLATRWEEDLTVARSQEAFLMRSAVDVSRQAVLRVPYGKADATKDWLASILQARDNVRIPDMVKEPVPLHFTGKVVQVGRVSKRVASGLWSDYFMVMTDNDLSFYASPPMTSEHLLHPVRSYPLLSCHYSSGHRGVSLEDEALDERELHEGPFMVRVPGRIRHDLCAGSPQMEQRWHQLFVQHVDGVIRQLGSLSYPVVYGGCSAVLKIDWCTGLWLRFHEPGNTCLIWHHPFPHMVNCSEDTRLGAMVLEFASPHAPDHPDYDEHTLQWLGAENAGLLVAVVRNMLSLHVRTCWGQRDFVQSSLEQAEDSLAQLPLLQRLSQPPQQLSLEQRKGEEADQEAGQEAEAAAPVFRPASQRAFLTAMQATQQRLREVGETPTTCALPAVDGGDPTTPSSSGGHCGRFKFTLLAASGVGERLQRLRDLVVPAQPAESLSASRRPTTSSTAPRDSAYTTASQHSTTDGGGEPSSHGEEDSKLGEGAFSGYALFGQQQQQQQRRRRRRMLRSTGSSSSQTMLSSSGGSPEAQAAELRCREAFAMGQLRSVSQAWHEQVSGPPPPPPSGDGVGLRDAYVAADADADAGYVGEAEDIMERGAGIFGKEMLLLPPAVYADEPDASGSGWLADYEDSGWLPRHINLGEAPGTSRSGVAGDGRSEGDAAVSLNRVQLDFEDAQAAAALRGGAVPLDASPHVTQV